MENLKNRLKKYISFDTKSNPDNESCPSTEGQLVLAKELVEELHDLGIENAQMGEHGYVYAKIKANAENKPAIGFVAHMDTSPDMDGKCVSPQVIDYEGGDIKLNDEYSITIEEFPFLNDLVGQKLMTTSGDTLLGADNKAGIAIIMTLAEYIQNNPEFAHGDICIAFTPDEEIGRGADLFDVERFGAEFAYTIDGGPEGELEYESFNAAGVKIKIHGKNVHPGSAKDIMVNSQLLAMEIESHLPPAQKPEYTSGYEGFFLLTNIEGSVEETKMQYIIRDHSKELFEQKKDLMTKIVDFVSKKHGVQIDLTIEDSYYNMREKIEEKIEIVDLAAKSYEECGVTPNIKPIRGGTDGSKLSFMGLPTPNIFTGGYNYHGRYEFISLDQMKKSFECVKSIIKNS